MTLTFPEFRFERIADPKMFTITQAEDGKGYPRGLLSFLKRASKVLPRPASLTVVVTADFEESVNERFVAAGRGAVYDSDRGGGMVAAKTLQLDADRIEIIVQAWLLLDAKFTDLAAEQLSNRDHMCQWTLTHELQHALVSQRDGERYLPLQMPDYSTITTCVENIAHQVQDEFRAEAATKSLVPPPTCASDTDLLESLDHYHQALREAYQRRVAGLGLYELSRLVLGTASNLCIALAYEAARMLDSQGTIEAPGSEVEGHPLWSRYVAPVWDELCDALEAAPLDRAPRDGEVEELRDQLAEWVFAFLAVTGFDMTPQEDGQDRVDFLEHLHQLVD